MDRHIPAAAVAVVDNPVTGWAVTLTDATGRTIIPYLGADGQPHASPMIAATVARTRCEIVADALRSNSVLRHAYETLALLESIDANAAESVDWIRARIRPLMDAIKAAD